mmetsp:Transcript_37139/g.86361  ORF Transcript_37139/g.86361 Transcript_37139/m.86361 type:complete len:286 (-) Transcript_37139:80-937(-)
MCQQQGCPLYGKISGYKPTLHWVPQNTGCEAWRKLVASVQRCARSRAARFCITEELTSGEMLQITTLPSSIGDCTDLEHLQLYGTNITRLPPEIGNLTSLQSFTPYTTHCLHWYPYELVHCGNLHDSTVSTRANYKHRSFEFPCLGRERYPLEALDPSIWRDYLASPSAPIRPCSVCRTPFEDYGHYRVWVSRVVATDVLPLLVNACSERCLDTVESDPLAKRRKKKPHPSLDTDDTDDTDDTPPSEGETTRERRKCHRGGPDGRGLLVDPDTALTKAASFGGGK